MRQIPVHGALRANVCEQQQPFFLPQDPGRGLSSSRMKLHRCRKDEPGTNVLADVKRLPMFSCSVSDMAHIWSVRYGVRDHVDGGDT